MPSILRGPPERRMVRAPNLLQPFARCLLLRLRSRQKPSQLGHHGQINFRGHLDRHWRSVDFNQDRATGGSRSRIRHCLEATDPALFTSKARLGFSRCLS